MRRSPQRNDKQEVAQTILKNGTALNTVGVLSNWESR